MPFGDPEYGDSVAVLGLRMATSPPFCNRFDPYDSLTVWQPKLGAPSNQSGKLRPFGGHNHKAIYRKNEYTTHRPLFDGRGVVPQGQKLRR
jgi:hypothetical protein